MDLIERIDHWGRETPERAAHISGDRTLTFGELLVRSDGLAAWIEGSLGANRGPVAVLGHKEPEMLIAFLAVVKSGSLWPRMATGPRLSPSSPSIHAASASERVQSSP